MRHARQGILACFLVFYSTFSHGSSEELAYEKSSRNYFGIICSVVCCCDLAHSVIEHATENAGSAPLNILTQLALLTFCHMLPPDKQMLLEDAYGPALIHVTTKCLGLAFRFLSVFHLSQNPQYPAIAGYMAHYVQLVHTCSIGAYSYWTLREKYLLRSQKNSQSLCEQRMEEKIALLDLQSSIEDSAACKICCVNLIDRYLPCGHVVCHSCLDKLPKMKVPRKKRFWVICPFCRMQINQPDVKPLFF